MEINKVNNFQVRTRSPSAGATMFVAVAVGFVIAPVAVATGLVEVTVAGTFAEPVPGVDHAIGGVNLN